MNATIVFYSRTGNTCLIAESLADVLDATLISIHPDNYYRGVLSAYIMGSLHALFRKSSPFELSAPIPAHTDLLIVGSPVWSNRIAPPVRSFLSQHVQTRLVAFFSTGRQKSERCLKTMQYLVPNSAQVLATSNFCFASGYSEAKLTMQVKDWAAAMRVTFNEKEFSDEKATTKN